MQISDYFNRLWQQDELRKCYTNFVESHPNVRQKDIANALQISEAEFVDAQLGLNSIRLRADVNSLIKDLPGLGYIMNLTRNAYAVHECKGCYQNISINGNMGLVIADDKKIDLRLFLSQWKYIFAVKEALKETDRYSLQFFDASGTAIQKIFLQSNSHLSHYQHLLETYIDKDQQGSTILLTLEEIDRSGNDSESLVDVASLKASWQSMTDVHQFVGILSRHNLGRLQAFQLIGKDYAEEFSPTELERVLLNAADIHLPIMCFVANKGSIQIFSGVINQVKAMGPWLNVLDPEFNLHLLETGITESWLVRKPTSDGIVTSLEFYDAEGNQVVQFFGQRKEGNKENPLWTQLAESVLATQSSCQQPFKQSIVA